MKKTLLFVVVPFFLIVCAALGLFVELQMYADEPAQSTTSPEVIINVRHGQSLRQTADLLYQKSIIKNSLKLILIARIKGYEKHLQAGEYLLSASMTPRQILEIMAKGEVTLHKLTIPEGYNLYQVADLVAQAGFGPKADFIDMATDSTLVRKMGLQSIAVVDDQR